MLFDGHLWIEQFLGRLAYYHLRRGRNSEAALGCWALGAAVVASRDSLHATPTQQQMGSSDAHSSHLVHQCIIRKNEDTYVLTTKHTQLPSKPFVFPNPDTSPPVAVITDEPDFAGGFSLGIVIMCWKFVAIQFSKGTAVYTHKTLAAQQCNETPKKSMQNTAAGACLSRKQKTCLRA